MYLADPNFVSEMKYRQLRSQHIYGRAFGEASRFYDALSEVKDAYAWLE